MQPASGLSPPTKISSPSGNTPTPTSPCSSKPRRKTRSCSSSDSRKQPFRFAHCSRLLGANLIVSAVDAVGEVARCLVTLMKFSFTNSDYQIL
jgi:hypothetical protein